MAGLFLGLTLYHRFILPHPASDVKRPGLTPGKLLEDFFKTFVTFFEKKNLGLMFFFLLTYRLGESQLAKIASPFLLDTTDKGGLGLSTATVGMIYGTIGVIALLLGGIISGFLVSRDGFKKWIIPMALVGCRHPGQSYIYSHLCSDRTVGVWFRLYRLYAISDLYSRR